MITIELVGELAEYVGRSRVEVDVKTPARLREVLDSFIASLSRPQRNMLARDGKIRAAVIVNGTLETDYDRIVTEGDKISLILPVEGGK